MTAAAHNHSRGGSAAEASGAAAARQDRYDLVLNLEV